MILNSPLVSVIFVASRTSALPFVNLIDRTLSCPRVARGTQKSCVSLFEEFLSTAGATLPLEALRIPTFAASGRIAQLSG
jgi:hypothetical protein